MLSKIHEDVWVDPETVLSVLPVDDASVAVILEGYKTPMVVYLDQSDGTIHELVDKLATTINACLTLREGTVE